MLGWLLHRGKGWNPACAGQVLSFAGSYLLPNNGKVSDGVEEDSRQPKWAATGTWGWSTAALAARATQRPLSAASS